MPSRVPLLVMGCVLSALVTMGCTSYTEDIGGGFLVRTRVYEGLAHEYKEFDLYYRGILGIRRLIHKDIRNAEVSPDGQRVLFFARRHRPEPLGMDELLFVFVRRSKETIKVEEGRFHHTGSYWNSGGDMFVYRRLHQPLVLFDLSTSKSRTIAQKGLSFLQWSPAGKKIAYATGKSVYEVNSLYFIDVDEPEGILVAEKEGAWRKEDFEWVTMNGEEKIIVKETER